MRKTVRCLVALALCIASTTACSSHATGRSSNSTGSVRLAPTPSYPDFTSADEASRAACTQFKLLEPSVASLNGSGASADVMAKVYAMANAAAQAKLMQSDTYTEQLDSVAQEVVAIANGGSAPQSDPMSVMGRLCA